MPLTAEEKEAIVSQVVAILRADDKPERIAALREQVMRERPEAERDSIADAVYAVVQAIDELYG